MKTLTVDKVGWKKLQTILDVFIKAINRATPLKGDGISLSETENGIIISIDLKSDDLAKVIDQILTGWLTFTWNGVAWQDLIIVDPATCVQSTIKVLTKLDGQAITVPLYFDPSTIASSAGTDTSNFVIYVMTGNPLQAITAAPK